MLEFEGFSRLYDACESTVLARGYQLSGLDGDWRSAMWAFDAFYDFSQVTANLETQFMQRLREMGCVNLKRFGLKKTWGS
jgi:hypothetical protein